MSIYLFSRPIHSGKTTELQEWCDLHENIAGVLMPDINGRRKILDIGTKEVFDIECVDAANAVEDLTSVGRFHFYTAAFEKGNTIILKALTENPAWLVIDEAGKLELEGKGFYRSILKALETYSKTETPGNLLIAVRDSLCETVVSFFKIRNCRVIGGLEMIGNP